MIVPNQLKNASFQLAGRGAYRAQDVDDFQKRVYVAYSELYSENSVLKKKFASLSALVEEYNEGKNSIANAIIKSQAISDKMIEDAKKQAADLVVEAKTKADEILGDSKKKADEYIAEKTSTADAYLSRAETELERVKKEAEEAAADYTAKVNEKAEKIIENANEQASKIVAAAYADAKLAREKCDEIINSAKVELDAVKKDIALLKVQTEKMISVVMPALDKIEIPKEIFDEITSEVNQPEAESIIPTEESVARFEFRPSEPNEVKADIEEYNHDEEEVVDVKDEDEPGISFEDISSSSDLESYFSSIIDNIQSAKNAASSGVDAQEKLVNDEDSDNNSEESIYAGEKGYNGNNTSFKPASGSGFVVTDFEDEDEDEDQ